MTALPVPLRRTIAPLIILALFAGCAQLPTGLRPAPALAEQAAARAAQGDYRTAAELYRQAARSSRDPARSRYLLQGGEAAARGGYGGLAQQLLDSVTVNALNEDQRARLELARLEARIAGRPAAEALSLLPPPGGDAPPAVAARIWSLRADLLFAQGQIAQGVHALVQRDVWLLDPAAVKANDYRIWKALKQHPRAAAEAQSEDSITQGWLDLAAIGSKVWSDRADLEDALARWERLHPGHPAARHILPERFDYSPTLPAMAAGQGGIGLALPLSGQFAGAAAALRDGFLTAYYDSEAPRPSVHVYDTALIPGIPRLLERARADGVGLLVGPLGKQAVADLAEIGDPGMLVLALNYTDTGNAFPGFYQFGLAPEDEARAAARRALAQGLDDAIVLVPEGEWGSRILSAFRDALDAGGGKLLDYARYDPKKQDYGEPIKRLLRYRPTDDERSDTDNGGMDSGRRDDADFIFVAAQPDQARLIRTQLRFYHASRLPVFATSHVFSGVVDPQRDSDLNGMRFADMPWILGDDPQIASRRRTIQRLWPNAADHYPRLFAMGFDAWLLAQRLRAGDVRAGHLFSGNTGDLYLQPDGEIRRELSWARFSHGRPKPLGAPATIETGGETDGTGQAQPVGN